MTQNQGLFNAPKGQSHDTWEDPPCAMPVRDEPEGDFIACLTALRNNWLQKLNLIAGLADCNLAEWERRVQAHVEYLILMQSSLRNRQYRYDGGWCLPEDPAMPGDARVDFLYMPSYIAVATLVLIRQRFPAVTARMPSLDGALRRGLDFCSGRNLGGHGYDADRERIEAIGYLARGGVFSWFAENTELSPRFHRALFRAAESLQNRLRNNEGWGSVDEVEARQALQQLEPCLRVQARSRLSASSRASTGQNGLGRGR